MPHIVNDTLSKLLTYVHIYTKVINDYTVGSYYLVAKKAGWSETSDISDTSDGPIKAHPSLSGKTWSKIIVLYDFPDSHIDIEFELGRIWWETPIKVSEGYFLACIEDFKRQTFNHYPDHSDDSEYRPFDIGEFDVSNGLQLDLL